jgi:hypothetical protein
MEGEEATPNYGKGISTRKESPTAVASIIDTLLTLSPNGDDATTASRPPAPID